MEIIKKLRKKILEKYYIQDILDPKKKEKITEMLEMIDRIGEQIWWETIYEMEILEIRRIKRKLKRQIKELKKELYKYYQKKNKRSAS